MPALLPAQAASELQQQHTDGASAGHTIQSWSFGRPTVALQPSQSRKYNLVPFYHLYHEDTGTDDLHHMLAAAMCSAAAHQSLGSNLTPQARAIGDRGPYTQPEPANDRLEAPPGERASKRARADAWWTTGQVDVVGLGRQLDASFGSWQSLQFGQDTMATGAEQSQETCQGAAERDDDHMPAAVALASIQGMVTLMEEAAPRLEKGKKSATKLKQGTERAILPTCPRAL